MAGIPTADNATETLKFLRTCWRFLLARCKGDPNGAPFVAGLTAFGPTWAAANQKEMDKDDAVTDAEAGAVFADTSLDRCADHVSTAIHGAKKVNVNLPLHQLYFAGDSASVFKRPVLGAQLKGMESWPAILTAASEPALAAIAAEATTVVKAAEGAAKALSAAIADSDTFTLGGERKKVFDAYNAVAATAYGALKTFVHNNQQLNLPAGYAESFFLHTTSPSQPKTLGAANALVARLEQKLGKAKTAQADLVAKQAALEEALKVHAKAVADQKVAKTVLADAKKAAAAAEAQAKKVKPKKK